MKMVWAALASGSIERQARAARCPSSGGHETLDYKCCCSIYDGQREDGFQAALRSIRLCASLLCLYARVLAHNFYGPRDRLATSLGLRSLFGHAVESFAGLLGNSGQLVLGVDVDVRLANLLLCLLIEDTSFDGNNVFCGVRCVCLRCHPSVLAYSVLIKRRTIGLPQVPEPDDHQSRP